MNEDENEIEKLPKEENAQSKTEGLTFHWIQLIIGVAICYYWFYEGWKSLLFLAIVVIIHELGHVIVGKSFGCFIKEMQVFLLCFVSYKPKQVAGGSSWRNITWSLGTLPLGGFTMFETRPTEETDETKEIVLDEQQVAESPYIDDKPAWQRLLISAGGVLCNFASFLIMYFVEPMIPFGWHANWWRLMSFSLILAVLNILPVYPLDGGSIIFSCYEMATGRKPSSQFVNACGMIGFVLIILFFWVFPEWVHSILDLVFGVFF